MQADRLALLGGGLWTGEFPGMLGLGQPPVSNRLVESIECYPLRCYDVRSVGVARNSGESLVDVCFGDVGQIGFGASHEFNDGVRRRLGWPLGHL